MKYLAGLNSTLFCRSLVCFVGWVCTLFSATWIHAHLYPGCHVLALDLVRSWSFERPSTVHRNETTNGASTQDTTPSSPKSSRRSMFPLEPALRRRSSIMIDMEVSSDPPTRRASPERKASKGIAGETIKEEGDLLARKAGMGNLMKSAKQDVKVEEFDINAFF